MSSRSWIWLSVIVVIRPKFWPMYWPTFTRYSPVSALTVAKFAFHCCSTPRAATRARRRRPLSFFARLDAFCRPALGRHFLFVQITEGLRRDVHDERAVFSSRQPDIIQGDDARELSDIARKLPHIVIAARELQRDRQLGIELALGLCRSRPEQLELQAAAEPSLVDVHEQRAHLRPIG